MKEKQAHFGIQIPFMWNLVLQAKAKARGISKKELILEAMRKFRGLPYFDIIYPGKGGIMTVGGKIPLSLYKRYKDQAAREGTSLRRLVIGALLARHGELLKKN